MQKLFGKLNSKMAIIGIVSAIVVVLCIVGIVIGVNSKNNKSSNETENDKNVAVETTTVKETQTNKSTEGSKAAELSTENVTEEAATEKAGENVTEEAKAEENNVAENDASAGNNNSNNSQQNYNEPDTEAPATPSPEPRPEPQPEPETEVVEDHIVYKPDGSIDLNESYWGRAGASKEIGKSNEFQALMAKYYSIYGENAKFSISRVGGHQKIFNVYSYSYSCKITNTGERIKFEFNGKEFVEK